MSPSEAEVAKVIRLRYVKTAAGKETVAPVEGRRPKVKAGSSVKFVAVNAGASDLTVTFVGTSPFADASVQTVHGERSHRVRRFDPAGSNVYRFDCRLLINGVPVEAKGGGEMEVTPEG
jgi:hypothetical protein